MTMKPHKFYLALKLLDRSKATPNPKKDAYNLRISASFILFFFGLLSNGQQNQVCFTLDDLPVVSLSCTSNECQKNLTTKLLLTLNTHKIPATGFVNEFKL